LLRDDEDRQFRDVHQAVRRAAEEQPFEVRETTRAHDNELRSEVPGLLVDLSGQSAVEAGSNFARRREALRGAPRDRFGHDPMGDVGTLQVYQANLAHEDRFHHVHDPQLCAERCRELGRRGEHLVSVLGFVDRHRYLLEIDDSSRVTEPLPNRALTS
jgi:hypothetical protein